MKRILVTGASGFVGRHCLPLLQARGYEVHGLSRGDAATDSPDVRWHSGDLLIPGKAEALIAEVRPSHLMHLAWCTRHGEYWTSVENLQWVGASLSLIEEFARQGGERVVVAGTCAEYDWRYGFCAEHITPLSPATLYGMCKHSLWMIVEEFARQKALSVAWGRVFQTYGPWEHPDRLVASVIRAFLRGLPALCSDCSEVRDFLYVEDVADAFVAVLESKCVGAVNVGSGIPIALRDVVYEIAERTRPIHSAQFGSVPAAPNTPGLLVANVSRLKDEVGWLPKYALGAGLDRTIRWWEERLLGGS